MRTAFNIHYSTEAKVNAGVLAVVLFGLVLCGLAALIIAGGEDFPAGKEMALEDRQAVSPCPVIDNISNRPTEIIAEEFEVQKVRIESSRTESDKNAGSNIEKAFVPVETKPQMGGTLTGTVYFMGKPEGGVSITARKSYKEGGMKARATSSKDGTYLINDLSPGTYHLYSSLTNNKRTFRNYNNAFVQQGITVIDIHLGESGSSEVFGFVFENNQPAPHVKIDLSAKGFHERMTTDETGAYSFSGLPAQRISLHAFLNKMNSRTPFGTSKYLEKSKNIELIKGRSIRQDLHFSTGSSVLFGDVFENGSRVAGTYVWLSIETTDGWEPRWRFESKNSKGQDGYYFEFLPAGRYKLRTLGPVLIRKIFFLNENEKRRVDLGNTLDNGCIQGTVNALGNEKEWSMVSVLLFEPGTCSWKIGDPGRRYSLDCLETFNMDGEFFYKDQLPAGSYDVVAARFEAAEPYNENTYLKMTNIDIKRVTLAEGASITINLDLVKE